MSDFLEQIYTLKKVHKRALAVLIDPDQPANTVLNIVQQCSLNHVDFIFVGGSLVTAGVLSETLKIVKDNFNNPVYIFPGNEFMIDDLADGILFLSLISGRNPEYLIGKQIVAAPMLAQSNLDVVPTAYILIDGGKETSVSYISNTKPIPSDKSDIAIATALAGKLMGMKCIYMDAGSGALKHISPKMINAVKKSVDLPLVIGGGIRNAETATQVYKAGADIIVIGNGAEADHSIIEEIAIVRTNMTAILEA
ncbi:MAG: geranylgeranylglyceryl/heptaprenylglyceryl phosphate synthase [Bacteroidia bacterium]|nr:geranylgeranylglyceryl/heptaprenylglyceryl phosphate synthase [Bacteroidia bacterium]